MSLTCRAAGSSARFSAAWPAAETASWQRRRPQLVAPLVAAPASLQRGREQRPLHGSVAGLDLSRRWQQHHSDTRDGDAPHDAGDAASARSATPGAPPQHCGRCTAALYNTGSSKGRRREL